MSRRIYTHTHRHQTSHWQFSIPRQQRQKSVRIALAFYGKQFANTSTLIHFPIISTVHNANNTEIYLTKEVVVPFFVNFRQNHTGFYAYIRSLSMIRQIWIVQKPKTMSLQFVSRLNACHSITHTFLQSFILLLLLLMLCVNLHFVEYVERLSKQQNHQKVQQQCLLLLNTKDDECHIHGMHTSNTYTYKLEHPYNFAMPF